MDRRSFLQRSILTGAGLVAAAGYRPARAQGPRGRVIIAGAGLSGLVAAYELGKLNFDVTVLEAQERAGGRVLTVRDFGDNVYGEAGAARISAAHFLTLKYVDEFGLELMPFYPSGQHFMRLNGRKPEKVGWKKFSRAVEPVIHLGKPEFWKKIRGGNDLLPRAFAERLKDKIIFGAPVVKIEHDARGVTVYFSEKGASRSIRGDILLAAIPFTTLAKIEVSPQFSRTKTDVIRNTTYESASRVLIETNTRFWREQGMNGFALGPQMAEIWDSTFGQGGTHGILQNYVRYDASLALTRKAPEGRIAATVEMLGKLFPGVAGNYVKGFSKCWSEDPWTQGAWGLLAGPRLEAGRMPEGRVFFAGEHLSGHASWMQGALSSGLAAADSIRQFKFDKQPV